MTKTSITLIVGNPSTKTEMELRSIPGITLDSAAGCTIVEINRKMDIANGGCFGSYQISFYDDEGNDEDFWLDYQTSADVADHELHVRH